MMHTLDNAKEPVNLELAETANLLGALVTALSDEMKEAARLILERSESHAAAMCSVGEEPGSSIRNLSRKIGKSHSATVRIVDRLEAQGLLERSTSREDSRSIELRLTDLGKKLFSDLHQARISLLVEHLERLDSPARKALKGILDELLSSFPCDLDTAYYVCRFCDQSICHGQDCPVGRRFL